MEPADVTKLHKVRTTFFIFSWCFLSSQTEATVGL